MPRHQTKFIRNVVRYRELLFLLAIPVIYLLINNYLPMIGVIVAFKDYNFSKGIFFSPWSGFKNFIYLFMTRDSWIITRNTICYNLVFIALNIIVPVTFAILLNELTSKIRKNLYQTIMLFPYFISMIIVSYLVYSFLSSDIGLANKTILPLFHIAPIEWYNEPKYWPFILTFVNTWKNAGYLTIVYLASLTSIDPQYYESIAIDGGGKWKQIRFISLPMIQPIIIVMTLLAIGKIFNSDFGLFYQVPLQSGPLFPATNVIDTYVYRALLQTNNIPMASAAGFYQAIVGLVLVVATNFIVRKIDPEKALI